LGSIIEKKMSVAKRARKPKGRSQRKMWMRRYIGVKRET